LCPEHEKLFAAGYVALIECDPERSHMRSGAVRVMPEQAYRTGQIAHLKREAFGKAFNVPIAADQSCVFVEPGVIERLQTMVEPASD